MIRYLFMFLGVIFSTFMFVAIFYKTNDYLTSFLLMLLFTFIYYTLIKGIEVLYKKHKNKKD